MKEEIKIPVVPDLKREYFLMVKSNFLKENNLSIGDTIKWEFDYQITRSGYRRGEINRYGAN